MKWRIQNLSIHNLKALQFKCLCFWTTLQLYFVFSWLILTIFELKILNAIKQEFKTSATSMLYTRKTHSLQQYNMLRHKHIIGLRMLWFHRKYLSWIYCLRNVSMGNNADEYEIIRESLFISLSVQGAEILREHLKFINPHSFWDALFIYKLKSQNHLALMYINVEM